MIQIRVAVKINAEPAISSLISVPDGTDLNNTAVLAPVRAIPGVPAAAWLHLADATAPPVVGGAEVS